MRCSAVIPTLNEAARIGPTVQRLRAQGFDEVVVCDGGSGDDTARLAEAAGAQVVRGPRGRGQQLNVGARASTCEHLLFVHADLRLPDNALGWLTLALQAPGVVAAAFRTWHVDDTGRSSLGRLLHAADLRSRYSSLPYGDQGLFVRREDFDAVGGYPDQPLMEDLEMARRLRRRGRIWTLPACVEVSARRFVRSPVRSALVMNTFPVAYALGVPSERLARWYG